MDNPGSLARVQADAALIPGAVDESLRHCPSAPSSTRRTPVDFELGGIVIPGGSDLFFSFTAANRDPKKFVDPETFDIDRDASALLTFGGGAHFCLGAGLARMEARLVFEELFAAGRDFTLAEPVRWRANNPVVRAPERLMVLVWRPMSYSASHGRSQLRSGALRPVAVSQRLGALKWPAPSYSSKLIEAHAPAWQ